MRPLRKADMRTRRALRTPHQKNTNAIAIPAAYVSTSATVVTEICMCAALDFNPPQSWG